MLGCCWREQLLEAVTFYALVGIDAPFVGSEFPIGLVYAQAGAALSPMLARVHRTYAPS